jgi:hypothetical protein
MFLRIEFVNSHFFSNFPQKTRNYGLHWGDAYGNLMKSSDGYVSGKESSTQLSMCPLGLATLARMCFFWRCPNGS